MAVQANLLPSHSEKTLGAMKAERTVKRITFNTSEANPGETLYVSVPKLSEHKVIVSNSLAPVFNINLSGDHANNYLVQNVSRALVDKLAVKFAATTVQDLPAHPVKGREVFLWIYLVVSATLLFLMHRINLSLFQTKKWCCCFVVVYFSKRCSKENYFSRHQIFAIFCRNRVIYIVFSQALLKNHGFESHSSQAWPELFFLCFI